MLLTNIIFFIVKNELTSLANIVITSFGFANFNTLSKSSKFFSLCSLSDCVKIEVKEEKYTFLVTSKVKSGKYTLKNNNAERIEDQVIIVNKKIIFMN